MPKHGFALRLCCNLRPKRFCYAPMPRRRDIRCAPMLVAACLLLAAPTTAMKSQALKAHSPQTLPRRAFFQAATASAAGLASSAHATASFLADAPELKPPPGKPPNAPPSGPLANTPLGYQVGGGPRPEAEVREIDRARYKAAAGAAPAKTASFLDGVPLEAPDANMPRPRYARDARDSE